MTKMQIPAEHQWEMIIVDNGSVDDTALVVEGFKGKLPIRRVFEPKPGLSNARNTGVDAAEGDYILWTDDDVEVDEAWFTGYVLAFSRFPNGAVFGGRIIPILEGPSPDWFIINADILGNVLAVRDFGDNYLPLSINEGRIPYGANYAIRTTEQRQYRYDPELGVSPGKRRIGEETAVIREILMAGGAGYWVPNSKVFHIIIRERQTERYICDYHRGVGETIAYIALSKGHRSKSGSLIYHGSRALAHLILLLTLRTVFPPRRWLHRLELFNIHSGALQYTRKHPI